MQKLVRLGKHHGSPYCPQVLTLSMVIHSDEQMGLYNSIVSPLLIQ